LKITTNDNLSIAIPSFLMTEKMKLKLKQEKEEMKKKDGKGNTGKPDNPNSPSPPAVEPLGEIQDNIAQQSQVNTAQQDELPTLNDEENVEVQSLIGMFLLFINSYKISYCFR
jgi:hypothetical protein